MASIWLHDNKLWKQEHKSSNFILLIKGYFDFGDPLKFHMNFRISFSDFICLPKILTAISGCCFSNSIASPSPWTWDLFFVHLLGSLILWVNSVYSFFFGKCINNIFVKNIWYKSAYRVEVNFTLAQSFSGFLPWSLGPIVFETVSRYTVTETISWKHDVSNV